MEADTGASTYFEQVICDCWNIISKNPSMTFEEWMSLSKKKEMKFIKSFVKKYGGKKFGIPAVQKNNYEAALGKIYRFARLLHQKAKGIGGKSEQVGATKGAVSPWWNEMTAKKVDTWKTDIVIGSARISVKNGKGARLMSGVTEESVATLHSAAKKSKLDESLVEEIEGLMEGFVSVKLWNQPNTPLANANTTAGTKVLKTDKKERDKWVSDVNKDGLKILEAGLNLKKDVVAACEKAFRANPSFQNNFAYEACTGWEKFGGKVFGKAGEDNARADYMLAFSEDLESLRIEHMSSVNSKVIKHIAKQMTIAPDFKSNSFRERGKKKGQKLYQTFQMKLETIFNDMDKIQRDANEEIEKYENMLSEGLISELVVWDKIKAVTRKMWNYIKEMWSKAKALAMQFVEKVKQLLTEGLNGIMSAFDFDISAVRHKTEVDLL